jgi:hypothetical protein
MRVLILPMDMASRQDIQGKAPLSTEAIDKSIGINK